MKIEMVRLYDIYMPLLSERQSEILNLYYNEDQSLAEISENVGITRQGVRDCIVKAETQLEFFEEKLGLMQKLSDLSTDSTGRYVLAFDLAAAQMTDTVEIRLILDGDNCGEHISWSIKDYCEVILAGDYEQSFKDVVSAMLVYGAYAQNYFGYNTEKLAADITEELAAVTENAKPSTEGAATGVSMGGWTLMLDSNVTAKIYLNLDGVSADDIGVTITTPAGQVINVDSLEAVGARYRVNVTDITSGYLNDEYTVTITNKTDNTVMTIKSSAMCYVSAILAMENADPALVDLVTALKLYSNAADAYFGK